MAYLLHCVCVFVFVHLDGLTSDCCVKVYVCVCVCMCVYVCMYVCMCVCVYVCMCVCVYVCMCVCVYVCVLCVRSLTWMCRVLVVSMWMYVCLCCMCCSGCMSHDLCFCPNSAPTSENTWGLQKCCSSWSRPIEIVPAYKEKYLCMYHSRFKCHNL